MLLYLELLNMVRGKLGFQFILNILNYNNHIVTFFYGFELRSKICVQTDILFQSG